MSAPTAEATTSFENLVATARARGMYARRLIDAHPIPGGIRATVEMIAFGDLGSARRPVIVSDEPLAQQAIATSVPNVPPDVAADARAVATRRATIEARVLSSRIVRVRLSMSQDDATLAEPRDFGMLVDGALESFGKLETATLREEAGAISATIGPVTIRLERDPFAMCVESADLPDASVTTALDDRNVHGLLCTPPPGLLATDEGTAALWSWALTPDERLYGLGERFTPLDHRGAQETLWTEDAWGTTYSASYKNIPFLHSSRGYGLFFHTPAPLSLKLGVPSARAAQAWAGEDTLDLFIIFAHDQKEMLREYTRLTGRATMPPRWAFGVWLSRCRYQTRAEVEAVANRARAEDVPCDVLHIDPAWLETPGLSCDFTSNEEAFPDLAGMVRELGQRGFKISLWELPYISSRARRYREAAEAGYFLRDDHGNPICADFGVPPTDGHVRAVLDFTNPAARSWWQDQHRPWLSAGVAVFKTDFGEGVPLGAHAHNGMSGYTLHNLFPLLYNAAVHEVITQATGRPGMVWGRSGWAGTQRYPAQWGGDPKTDVWAMAGSLRGGLNLALSAPGVWAHDIGGFYGPPPSPEVYIRWAQFGLLSPLARAHGTTPREPWEFGAKALAIFRRYAKLRTRLNPYLYSVAWEAHEQGLPMLRPLSLEYPNDPVSATIDDQYLLGSDLLVAPIFDGARDPVARRVYLPPGEWIDFWTDARLRGGRYITRTAPLDTLPLYVRAGAILPLGPERAFIGDSAPDELTLEVYPASSGAESSARVIWDADGAATNARIRRVRRQWRLDINGEREVAWRVRWRLRGEIREDDLGRRSTAESILSS